MEDNAPDHKKYYHDSIPQWQLGLQKLEWPANSPDLNPIETIWTEMKDAVKERLGWNFTAKGIRGGSRRGVEGVLCGKDKSSYYVYVKEN